MPYRVLVPLCLAKTESGEVRYHYRDNANLGAPTNYGPVIPWLAADVAAHLIKIGVVERIEEVPVETSNGSDPVQDCLRALERLDVDLAAGAPACRAALRQSGHRHANHVVAEAVKARKAALAALSGTAAS